MHRKGKDLYQILDVDPTADPVTIRVAYRNLAKKYHPDVNTSNDAKARMQDINDAYRTLGDSSKRIWYDFSREREQIRYRTRRTPYTPQGSRQWTRTPPRQERYEQSQRSTRPRSASSTPRPGSVNTSGRGASRHRSPVWWLWLLGPILTSICSYDFNSSTNYRLNLPRPTPTVMWILLDQIQTPEILLEVPNWPLVFNEKFETNEVPLLKGSFKDQFTSGSRVILDGKYHWDISVNDQPYFDVVYYRASFSDFYLSVDVQKPREFKDSGYGVMFRCPNSNKGYAFYLTDNRKFSVLVKDYDEWLPLIDWTYSSAIKPIDINRLVVIAEGTHFDFYINSEYVGDLTDSRFSAGKVGLAVGFEEGATGEYAFDNFELRQPLDSALEPFPSPSTTPTPNFEDDPIQHLKLDHFNLITAGL